MDFNFNERLENLKNEISANSITEEKFIKTIEDYKKLGFEIQKYLEYAIRTTKGGEKEKIEELYKKFLLVYSGEMTEKLRNLGYALKQDENFQNVRKALSDQAFRIMERARHSQRSEVFYMLARIFVANKKDFPYQLAQAFNPNYSDELFKTFIYSFLSGILGDKKQEE